ncbi:AMP-binding enzyme [Kibdelosporangium phytohabitans]
MPGYWSRPELTATALRDGWLHTGDLGRFDDHGYPYLAGRIKDIIIANGCNHYAGPIEDALTSHPAVGEAAVVAVPDDHTGGAAHVFVVAPGIEANELLDWASGRLGVPVTITVIDTMPTTALGKPGKKELARRTPRP